jgi:hypothetical protein
MDGVFWRNAGKRERAFYRNIGSLSMRKYVRGFAVLVCPRGVPERMKKTIKK